MRKNDSVSSLFCLCLGLVFMGGGVKMGLGPLNAPGPGFFPAVLGGVLSSLSTVLFVTAARRKGLSEKGRFWKQEGSWRKILPSLLSRTWSSGRVRRFAPDSPAALSCEV